MAEQYIQKAGDKNVTTLSAEGYKTLQEAGDKGFSPVAAPSAASTTQAAAAALRTATVATPEKKYATVWNSGTGKKLKVELDDKGKMLDTEKQKIVGLTDDFPEGKWSLWTGGKATGQAAIDKIKAKAAAALLKASEPNAAK